MFAEMSSGDWVSIIGAIFGGLTSLLGLWIAFKLKENTDVTGKTYQAVNGHTERRVQLERAEAHAIGVEQGKALAKQEAEKK